MQDDRVNCERARANLLKRGTDPQQVDAIINAKFGCKVISKDSRVTIDGFKFHSCLCNFRHPLYNTYADLNEMLRIGLLPDSGTYLDQSARTLEGIKLLRHLEYETQRAEQDKAKKKAERKNGRQQG